MQKASAENTPQGFILPNLCADQSLLLLLMAAELLVIAFVVFEQRLSIDWVYFGQVSLYVQWQVILSVLVLCRLRMYLAALPRFRAASLAYIVLLLIALLIALSVAYFNHESAEMVLRNSLLSAIVSGLALRYFYLQQQLVEREKSTLQAHLVALQAKIKPHFLFNTMNSIASLISIEPEQAERMIENLSELLRASLRDGVVETSLAEEWHLCECYLAIEKIRLGQRLTWQADFSAVDTQWLIPALSLQPLVENAIYHGIQPSSQNGFVRVKAWCEGEELHITVINSKPEQSDKKTTGHQLAVENIRLRLSKLYGNSAKLSLTADDKQFTAHLSYNYKKDDE